MLRKLSNGSSKAPEVPNIKMGKLAVSASEAQFVINNFGFWAKKRGAWNKGMRRRWFEVQGSRINYWLKREDAKLAGTCRGSIKVRSIEPTTRESPNECELTIFADTGRMYSLIVEDSSVALKVRGLFRKGTRDSVSARSSQVIASAIPQTRGRGLSTVFLTPEEYDFSKSTAENYKDKGENTFGKFADIRDTLDFDYHGNYTRDRQIFQDVLLQNVTGAGHRYDSPWIVFTAGAMGAGKSHTISWMSSQGYFPLPDFVQLDPDVFREAFPEWPEYRAADAVNAGHNTHLEAGYLVEIAMQHGLTSGHHIWVDGSLRDHEWFKLLFAKIHREHPQYQIAILFVFAEQQVSKLSRVEGLIVPY
jgi:hypothetical protein